MRTLVKLVVLAAVLGGLVYGGSIGYYAISAARPGTTESFVMLVKKGEPPVEIARRLESAGVISNRQWFLWLGKLMGQWKNLKAGEYKVSGAQSPLDVLSTITSGISVAHPVTIREGENMYEIATDLEGNRLVS